MKYFDNASSTYIYPEVIDIITETMKQYGNASNLHSAGLEAKKLLEDSRKKIATCLNIDPQELFFTSCASESNAFAINQYSRCGCSIFDHHDIKENKRSIIVPEHYCSTMKSSDYSQERLKSLLISHLLVNNETGQIFDLKEDIDQAHDIGASYLVDATQALGNIEVNPHDLGADYMSFSLHKCHAPKGIGLLYVKQGIESSVKNGHFDPIIYGSQEKTLRGGTENIPYIVGAAYAVEKSLSEMDMKNIICKQYREIIINGLTESGIDFMVNEGDYNIPSILNIVFNGVEGSVMMLNLDAMGICVSTGSACNTGDLKPSEVLTAMNVPPEYINGALRISMSLNNTLQDVNDLTHSLIQCYKDLKEG